MIKLIFFDIDGTLRPFETGLVPDSTKKAMERSHSAGIRTAIATGRHWMEIRNEKLIDKMRFDAFVTLDGEYCYTLDPASSIQRLSVSPSAAPDPEDVYFDPAYGTVVQRIEIPREDIRELLRMIEEEPFPCLFEEERHIYANMVNADLLQVLYDIKTSAPPIEPVSRAMDSSIYMLIPVMSDARSRELEQRLSGCQLVRWSDGLSFDLTRKGITKVSGVNSILSAYGLDPSECAAVGDGWNDIDMLKHVGLGIAMGNAKQECKDAADFICPPILEDGLADAIDHIIALNASEA